MSSSEVVLRASAEAQRFVEPLGRRWRHVQAVARAGSCVGASLGLDVDALEASCWLHDIGYAPELASTGFHPLDGARHLQAEGWDSLIVSMVAHHSCARLEAVERGLGDTLVEEFARPPVEYEDALCYCDMTNGPSGDLVTAAARLDEIEERYGPGAIVTRFIRRARPEILASAARVEERLKLDQQG